MKEIEGFIYSRKEFEGYKLRMIVSICDENYEEYSITIYTSQPDIVVARNALLSIMLPKVKRYQVVHYATKEQDDFATELINSFLEEK